MYYLTINAGSSSIKFSLFDVEDLQETFTGSLSGIGFDSPRLRVTGGERFERDVDAPNHDAAIRVIRDWLYGQTGTDQVVAIGHRVVHGGPELGQTQVITDDTIERLRRIIPLDPEHLPAEISLIERMRADFSGVRHIACFDTAFFHDLPTTSRLLPLPRRFESQGIRRYGFHGLSYMYLLNEFERVAGTQASHGKVIIAHLGNGASLAAVKNRKPIETSMGMSPAGGVPMSTRSGDIDPGVLTYLAGQHDLSPDDLRHLVGSESGLLGISEVSSDMKHLLDIEDIDPQAHDAVEIFCYHIRKYIGAYAAALGGLDSLIFSGGIGEVSAPIRKRVCDDLGFLGILLDDERNRANEERISADGARVGVHVLVTNEAATMAREMRSLLL